MIVDKAKINFPSVVLCIYIYREREKERDREKRLREFMIVLLPILTFFINRYRKLYIYIYIVTKIIL